MLNKVVLMGRLTRDPILRRTQTGTAVASFTLACRRDTVSADGEKKTDFIDCAAWRSTGEFINRYFVKGQMAVVEGRLQVRYWETDDGQRRNTVEVIADNIYFCEGKRKNTLQEREEDSYYTFATGPEEGDYEEITDGELPF